MENIETLLAAVAHTQGFDDDEPVVSTAPTLEPSTVVPRDARPSAVMDVPLTPPSPAIPERMICAGEKRKRGRPPKGQLVVKPPPPKRNKPEDEEDDVCFICFDGGSLVLCDRKGCPKAYHPACIKRDEAFFKSKAKWNCGWHICSVCQKASYYMCYTCTYSLCKKCTKDAEYLCVRGNKGFCSTCMKTIMLIEKQNQANNEVQVDFDDETSWEYLFKVYWVVIKEKLSLTLNDLTRAKKPWKNVPTIDHKPVPGNVISTVTVHSTNSCTEHLELNKPHVETNSPLPTNSNHVDKLNDENGWPTKPTMDKVIIKTSVVKEPGIEKDRDTPKTTRVTDEPCICKNMTSKETEWATKDLLEFVAHLKNGDMSAISRIDVQTLLLDYINRNDLWDPRRKSRIICDPTLGNLFGKPHVGHIEMLKLLESRFLVKEDSQEDPFIPAGFVSSVKSDMELDESEEDIRSDDNSKKGKEEIYVQGRSITIDKTEDVESNNTYKYADQVNIPNLAADDRNDNKDVQRSRLENATTSASVGNSPSSNNIEIEKLWHYRDPDGKIRGPFSMMQLREWSTTGLYLPDMRIWTNHEQYDSLRLDDALNGNFHGACDLSNSGSREEGANAETGVISEGTNVSGGDSKQIEAPSINASVSPEDNNGVVRADEFNTSVISEYNNGVVRADEFKTSGIFEDNNGAVRADESGTRQCWDFLKGNNSGVNNDVKERILLPSSSPGKKHEALPDCGQEINGFYPHSQNGKKNTQNRRSGGCEVENKSNNEYEVGLLSDENVRSLNIDLSSNDMGLSKSQYSNKKGGIISVSDFPSPAQPNTAKNQQTVPSNIPMQNSRILELLSPAPRSVDEDQGGPATNTKKFGLLNFSMPNSGQIWNGVGAVQIPVLADDWCKFPSAFSLKPPEITCDNPTSNSESHHQLLPSHSNIPNWLADINEPIEFDALGEEYVSDLLAEVDAMESQGPLHSPTSAIKFAREFLEDCKDGCFGSIEEFSSSTPRPRKSDASSTSETQLNFQSCKPVGGLIAINSLDSLARSNVHSSTSSEGETHTAGFEFHQHVPNAGQDMSGGASMGNINLVTVQGNVNLVLGGGSAGQGMENNGWGTNPCTSWVNSNPNHGPVDENLLPRDGQRKYNGERYTSPREWAYQGARAPWGRQPTSYGGGGYSRPILPKGQRVCKFYESGRCKKGAFCDYLHP